MPENPNEKSGAVMYHTPSRTSFLGTPQV